MQHKILIVDDDKELLKMLRSFFEIKSILYLRQWMAEAMKMLAVSATLEDAYIYICSQDR